MFPIITQELQRSFEARFYDKPVEGLPMICGYYGRACRQMGKQEGANRMNCTYCPLARYAEKH